MDVGGLHLHFDARPWAVVFGAVLATLSGFSATQLEGLMRRRQRERSAALFFGELLSALELIIGVAQEERAQGQPFGAMTMRVLRAAGRELEVYHRNREALYDLRRTELRGHVHSVMARIGVAVEGINDLTGQIRQEEQAILAVGPDHPARDDALDRLERLLESRERAFELAVEAIARAPMIIVELKPLAKQDFKVYATAVRDP